MKECIVEKVIVTADASLEIFHSAINGIITLKGSIELMNVYCHGFIFSREGKICLHSVNMEQGEVATKNKVVVIGSKLLGPIQGTKVHLISSTVQKILVKKGEKALSKVKLAQGSHVARIEFEGKGVVQLYQESKVDAVIRGTIEKITK